MVYVNELTEERLQEFITKREFIIYLQPQYSVSESTVVGAEALVRWIHEGTFISPGEFIPVLEQKGLIAQLDRYVWECVFSLQSQRQQAGLALVPISVNVSREDFSKTDVYQTMTALSSQYGILPEYVHIEITESAFVNDNATIYEAISKLKSFGFMILIDDFGSGYSALNILKDIEADTIKLDMKFFDLTEKNNTKGRNIIDSVIQMAQLLRLGLIAEGVENTQQLDILKEAGCDIIQGYFFYRPMDTDAFNALLDGIPNNSSGKTKDVSSFSRECYEECRKLTDNGNYNDALTLAKRTLNQLSLETDARLYCELENLIGAIYGGLGNELMALEHYLSGLSVSTGNDISAVSSRIYNNIGAEYQRLSDFEHSIKYLELALSEMEKNANDKNFEILAFKTNLNLCVGYTELGKYKKAEEYLNRANTYIDHPSVINLRFHYLTIQSELFMKIGRQEEVRESFPALVEAVFKPENGFSFWDSFERVGNLALELNDYAALKRVLDGMEWKFNQLPEELIELDIQVRIQEFRLAYYDAVGDPELLRREERTYIELCKKLCLQTKHDRATTIDYKIQLKTEYDENAEQRKKLDTDRLTGVGNRYKLEKDYKLLQKNSEGNHIRIGIGIIDLDYFKEFNDAYGHLQGDRYLKVISQIIKKLVADIGEVYRYGGDEFVVLLVDVDTSTIEQIAQQILEDAKRHQLCTMSSSQKIQTVSQGYVVLEQFKDIDIGQLLSYADRQLYSVKHNGRQNYKIQQL